MSTKNVEGVVTRSTVQGSGAVRTAGRFSSSVGDNTGIHPAPGTEGKPTTSAGGKLLNTFGIEIPDNTIQGNEAEYTQVYETTTPGGHSIEYNDTSGSERIMIRHANGTGVNIGPDGSVIISSKRRVDVVNEEYNLSVTGDGKMSFQGNLSLSVTGDLNIDVGGEFNVSSQKKTEKVNGPSVTKINGDNITTVNGNETNLVTGGGVIQYFEGLNTIVKGDARYAIQGDMLIASSSVLTMTAEQEVVITSPEANIAADNLSLFGDTGTIGGENIQMYTKNIRVNHTAHITNSINTDTIRAVRMDATVVHADLDGNARTATTAGTSLSQSYPDGSGPGYGPSTGSNPGYSVASAGQNDDDVTETALPTSTLLEDYRVKGSKGVKNILIDPEDVIKNNIDLSAKTAGVTNNQLSPAQVRSKMRDPAHRNNSEFVALMQSQGNLSPEYAKTIPPNISTIIDTTSIVIQGQTPIGSPSQVLTSKRIKAV